MNMFRKKFDLCNNAVTTKLWKLQNDDQIDTIT